MSRDLDAAVATLGGERRLVNDQLEIGRIRGLARAALGMGVAKSGRSSGVTSGKVTGVEGVTQIDYAGVQRLIRQVISIDPEAGGEVSRPGDSGAIWLEHPECNGVGLHFAGGDNPERALALDLGAVLGALDVDLDTSVDVSAREPVAVGARLTRW
jgi:endonuclease G